MLKSRTFRWLVMICMASILVYSAAFWVLRNPVLNMTSTTPRQLANVARLVADVRHLASSEPSRAYHNVQSLNRAADYIESAFEKTGCPVVRQSFEVGGNQYHNVICSFGPLSAPRLVIGAHYDVAGDDNPGADDNASGTAGVLELARLIQSQNPTLTHRVDLVAYTLEEPPSFRSPQMGSYAYAKMLVDEKTDVRLSVSVEMIGYFSDAKGSQHFPVSLLKLFYPDTGNFIAVVGSTFERKRVAAVKALMSETIRLPVYSLNAPTSVPGIDFSDHWSFWQNGLPAVMVTDTAFLRNANYHQPTDTPDTLDYRRMAEVVDGLFSVVTGYRENR